MTKGNSNPAYKSFNLEEMRALVNGEYFVEDDDAEGLFAD